MMTETTRERLVRCLSWAMVGCTTGQTALDMAERYAAGLYRDSDRLNVANLARNLADALRDAADDIAPDCQCITCGHWPDEHAPLNGLPAGNGCAGCDAQGYAESVIEHAYVPTHPYWEVPRSDCDCV